MKPIDWIVTLLWDASGARRRAQLIRLARSRRKGRQYDVVNRRALEQIRRAHEVVKPLVGRHD